MKFPLGALLGGVRLTSTGNSELSRLRDMIAGFEDWRRYYEKRATEKIAKAAKLELIGESSSWERSSARDAAADAERCLVGIRALKWAIAEITAQERAA